MLDMIPFYPQIAENYVLWITVLFGISESLALLPQVKANSVFQLVHGALSKVTGFIRRK